MDKKKRTRELIVFAVIVLALLAGCLLTPSGGESEPIQEVMRDAVLHEQNKVSLFGLIEVNPGLISAYIVTGILIVFALVCRLFVIPKFKYVPGRFQLVLEQIVGMFDGLAEGSSPHRNKFLRAYIFTAGVYIFVSTLFELLGIQVVTTSGHAVSLPAPLSDINGAIALGVMSYGVILFGGIKRIGAVAEKLVPVMSVLYIIFALVVIFGHAGNIGPAFGKIFATAFTPKALGGAASGIALKQTIVWGLRRSAFSNEAGLGSAVMVNSASNVKEPVHQGMWGVFEVFADTIVVCTLTALVILTTGVVDLESGAVLAGVQDNALVGQAFTAAFGSFGPKFIAISILLFAYSTTLGWSHYGTKAVEYLFGTAGSRIYKVVFVCMTVVGATMKLGLAWDLSDTFNGLMMIPNLIGVLALSGTVVAITRNYFDRRVKGKDIEPMWSAFPEYQKQEEAEAAAEEAEQEKAANQ